MLKYCMKLGRLQLFHYAKQLLTYAPAPIFFVMGIYSTLISQHNHMCGGTMWEMPLMWFLMALTHSYPWVVYWEVAGCKHCGCSAMDEIQRKDSSAGF
jgi:hypothetical protein